MDNHIDSSDNEIDKSDWQNRHTDSYTDRNEWEYSGSGLERETHTRNINPFRETGGGAGDMAGDKAGGGAVGGD